MTRSSRTSNRSAPKGGAVTTSEFAVLQEIEGNPLNTEDLALFAMFEREGWDEERRAAYITQQLLQVEAERLAAE